MRLMKSGESEHINIEELDTLSATSVKTALSVTLGHADQSRDNSGHGRGSCGDYPTVLPCTGSSFRGNDESPDPPWQSMLL